MKTTADGNGNEISKESIVRYGDGWMKVRAVFKNHVNLGPIFYDKTTIKKVPTSEIYEDYDAWYDRWTKSETYLSM